MNVWKKNSPMRNAIEKIYFCFSFGFLLARTTMVSLFAATIHDESLLPAPILYSVSANSFCTEVRFQLYLFEKKKTDWRKFVENIAKCQNWKILYFSLFYLKKFHLKMYMYCGMQFKWNFPFVSSYQYYQYYQ